MGVRVTISWPRGSSKPNMDSIRELLPLDWSPTTTTLYICGHGWVAACEACWWAAAAAAATTAATTGAAAASPDGSNGPDHLDSCIAGSSRAHKPRNIVQSVQDGPDAAGEGFVVSHVASVSMTDTACQRRSAIEGDEPAYAYLADVPGLCCLCWLGWMRCMSLIRLTPICSVTLHCRAQVATADSDEGCATASSNGIQGRLGVRPGRPGRGACAAPAARSAVLLQRCRGCACRPTCKSVQG